MDLPRRILDGGADEWERSVLASASLDRPAPELRARLRQDLGLAVGTGLAATAATSKSLGALGLKWTVLGLLMGICGAAGLSGMASWSRSEVEQVRAVAVSPVRAAPPESVAQAPTDVSRTAPAPALEVAAAPVVDVASASRAQPNRPAASAPAPAEVAVAAPPTTGPVGSAQFAAPTESELSAQLAAIRSVRAALAANQAQRALSQIDAYERTYPGGLLLVEAEILRIDATAALGNRDAVTRLGRAFLTKYPGSPYARHVQSLLDKEPQP